ncbi:5'-nucleotidase SurE [Paraconexibacter sp. AEG42_29]|uniref:5'-nucleotidase SurE n=1 Tax=Paraconexibacter sp. AEG42_29 TaxID=2997339 RepID=A0AAU7AS79_9ACTN
MRVLLTNDDGVDAEGLQVLRRALAAVPGIDLQVIAPDGNRSAIGRGITTRRALMVQRVRFDDGSDGYATDGTPVDCVRLAALGLIDGWTPDLVVAGINHGSNLGDDVTYSGTVAAAMEGLMLGLPAVAVSQQSDAREMDFRQGDSFGFDLAARFTVRLIEQLEHMPLPPSTLLNVNVPAGDPSGVEVARLGRRIYRDRLDPQASDSPVTAERAGASDPPQSYFIYGAEPGFEDDPGTDLNAVHEGRIAVTPVHLDLTHHQSLGVLGASGLDRLLA